MSKKVLITYATKAGSTAEVAARMGETLSAGGLSVDVKPVASVSDISAYNGIILGSAIRVGKILPEMTELIEKNASILQQKPFGLFICCMTLEKDTEENRKAVSAYLDPVRAVVQPDAEGLFAGVMNLKKLNLIEQLMMKAMKAPVGDFRNWEQIDGWTKSFSLN